MKKNVGKRPSDVPNEVQPTFNDMIEEVIRKIKYYLVDGWKMK